jgi:hypothetical protein
MSSDSDRSSVCLSRWSWATLALGLAIWFGVQGYLILMPVFSRSGPPEPKDTLPYIARTERMEKCFWGDCPALKDLGSQFAAPSPSHEVEIYRSWAATIFGSNQVGLSLVLLILKQAGLDVMTGYRVACVLAVLLFGTGFAYLLTVLWGRAAAGLALLLLAFKVFPDTGLNFVVPSNLCMGLATLIWARVISRRGKALWTLGIGSLVLVAFHPMGAAYALIAGALALGLSGVTLSRRMLVTAALVVLVLVLAIIMPTRIYNLSEYFSNVGLRDVLTQGGGSIAKVVVEVVNLGDGLYGALPFFLTCIVLGVIVASPGQRDRVAIFLKIYSVLLVVSLFYPPRQPADTFFRMWIPLVVVLFGAIAMAWKTTLVFAWEYLKKYRNRTQKAESAILKEAWPLLIAAMITGYAVQMSFAGAEQVTAMSEHFKNLWPLKVCSRQTGKLLAEARPGDRVLYESMMLMNCYFAKGALDLGAVYYHPVLQGTVTETEWLKRPDLRFVVAFNPLAVHPNFVGLHERKWGVSCPEFRFSPLSGGRRHGPMLHEDGISVLRFKHMDIEWPQDNPPKSMTLVVDNSGSTCSMIVSPIGSSGQPSEQRTISLDIPARWEQQVSYNFEGTPNLGPRTDYDRRNAAILTIDISSMQPAAGLRLGFPTWNSRVRIVGLRFDDSKLNWPWEHKARVIVPDSSCQGGVMAFSFDPAQILPKTLRNNSVRVIDDCGSSVLLEIIPTLTGLPK